MGLRVLNDIAANCTMFKHYIFVLEWTPMKHYVPGTQIELRSNSLRSFISWKYVKIEMEKTDISFRWKVNPSISDRQMNSERVIFRGRLQYGISKGESCKIYITVIPPVWAGVNCKLSIWCNDVRTGDFDTQQNKESDSECEMEVKADQVERLSVYSNPMPDNQGKVKTCIVPEDRFGNPTFFEKPVSMKLDWLGKQWNI